MTTTPERRTATLSELVAEEIRALMGRRRMTQAQLARGIGKTEMWVSLRLRGKQPIDMNDLALIARALDVGIHDLLPPPEVAAAAMVMARFPAPSIRPTFSRRRDRHHADSRDSRTNGRTDSRRPTTPRRTARLTQPGLPEAS